MKWSLALMWVLGGCDLYWADPGDRAGGRDHHHFEDGGRGGAEDGRPSEDGALPDALAPPDAPPDAAPDAPPDAAPDAPPDAAPVVPPCDLFADPDTFPTGVNPTAIAVGDFNADGSPDVAILDFSSEAVSVHLNATAPGATTPVFSAASNIAIGYVVTAFAAGDINGDGKADLVVPGGNHSIALLINNTAPGAATAASSRKRSPPTKPPPTWRWSTSTATGASTSRCRATAATERRASASTSTRRSLVTPRRPSRRTSTSWSAHAWAP